ncbi:hypothetical protein E2C01_049735 [Portunus trituberculatus]|uniref:Uncharacterized protein n=1 Tax=Portunus trituberculatus TaxID=210409 RepID=A0A5B7G767_PORTR|nr:hypothetical protein [Portunus trituberculatus]
MKKEEDEINKHAAKGFQQSFPHSCLCAASENLRSNINHSSPAGELGEEKEEEEEEEEEEEGRLAGRQAGRQALAGINTALSSLSAPCSDFGRLRHFALAIQELLHHAPRVPVSVTFLSAASATSNSNISFCNLFSIIDIV